jgi:hypothetical protein
VVAVHCRLSSAQFSQNKVCHQDVKERIGLAVVEDAALTQPFLFTLDRVTSPLPLAHATPTVEHPSQHSVSKLYRLGRQVNAFLRSRGPSDSSFNVERGPRAARLAHLVLHMYTRRCAMLCHTPLFCE